MSKIHIALVSREALPVYYIIAELRPDKIHLIGTKESDDVMNRIENVLVQQGFDCCKHVTQPYDIKNCMEVCSRIQEQCEGDEVSYNLTCGTKPMAIGAMRCAQNHGARMFYTDSKTMVDINSLASSPLSARIDNETLFTLQGQRLKEWNGYAFDKARTECSLSIKEFIEDSPQAYECLMKEYMRYRQLPKEYSCGKVDYCRTANKEINIEYNYVNVFSSTYPGAFDLLFKGRWWETLVADAVNKWSGGKYEIWTNVRFEPNTEQANKLDKNEIDVLVNLGNTLLFVECKSGAFTQDNIYKLGSVCQTYGSYKSKGVIIAYRKNAIKKELVEKAHDEKIDIIVANKTLSNISSELNRICISLKS